MNPLDQDRGTKNRNSYERKGFGTRGQRPVGAHPCRLFATPIHWLVLPPPFCSPIGPGSMEVWEVSMTTMASNPPPSSHFYQDGRRRGVKAKKEGLKKGDEIFKT